jgi:Xaa-Pro aminopeptidase
VTAESLLRPPTESAEINLAISSDRRADIDAKQGRVAALLQQVGCEGLLLLEPENFSWMTSGATPRGILDSAAAPGAYCTAEGRWLLCANVDSQRLFDEEIDGLGFQLKEWPWHWGREQLLADLCHNRKLACDRPVVEGAASVVHVAEPLRRLRRQHTPYEQACMLALGQLVSHALEATCRTLSAGETEREVAGQLSHRFLHRGVLPVHIGVAADGRARIYRHQGFTPTPIERYAVLTATARKYGLTATASRAVCFGALPEELRQDQNAVCRVSASYLASTWPDAVPREVLLAGRRIYLISGYEHDWALAPQGHVTGRSPVEMSLAPNTADLLQPGWVVVWHASAGVASSCDTFLVTDHGPKLLTPTEVWPLKRIRIQGAECVRPDILQR